ncbi:hypothetical protein CISG_06504 [Coccidioides immitis RMSCC 3703]|uniref:Uncharacterized protein n=2 Tax=Coccidioides immitis TaxID=5501 RepID=A0A0J8TUK3_COCIT|nr:hypothetical protein CIRG_04418 [Coccidioides immitis RMSCC 2394]KMU77502.1 hypothetical protein CISG_06504 [Coccidioides immitis RMSCC 3703]
MLCQNSALRVGVRVMGQLGLRQKGQGWLVDPEWWRADTYGAHHETDYSSNPTKRRTNYEASSGLSNKRRADISPTGVVPDFTGCYSLSQHGQSAKEIQNNTSLLPQVF